MCRGTSHFQTALKPSTSHCSKCIPHPFFLLYAEKGLLAATLIGAQWSQCKQAMRKVSVCCASLQVPLFSTSNQCNFPSQLSWKWKGFIRNSRLFTLAKLNIVVRCGFLPVACTHPKKVLEVRTLLCEHKPGSDVSSQPTGEQSSQHLLFLHQ